MYSRRFLNIIAYVNTFYSEDREKHTLETSVADPNPNPDPPDPHVFGPPGPGSGSLYHHGKIVRKNLIPTIL
jgi:hypothetical protein